MFFLWIYNGGDLIAKLKDRRDIWILEITIVTERIIYKDGYN